MKQRARGITFKLLASFLVLLLLPLLVIPFATFNVSNGSLNEGAEYFGVSLTVVLVVVLPLMVCTLLTARMIKKKVLNPLKELTVAAENIVQGNLDFQVAYRSDDEMGRLSSMFEFMRQRLVESERKQQAYEQARNDLIASISHDLRTPLSSIRGYVEGLKDGVARDKAQFDRYLTVIRDKTDKLDDLIEDLFRFSELESGHLPISLQEYDSRALLESLVAPLEKEFETSVGYSESDGRDESTLQAGRMPDGGNAGADGSAGVRESKRQGGSCSAEGDKLQAEEEFFAGKGQHSGDVSAYESGVHTVQVSDEKAEHAVVRPTSDGKAEHTVVRPSSDGKAELTVVRPFPEGKVMADPVRLTQVFDNLVGNAVKYAGEGASIVIAASIFGSGLEVTVRDNGKAIAPEHLPHIFDRFYRADASRGGEGRGSGLGLAICKYIIEEHEGIIGASSREGEGNRFYFRLPLLPEK